MGFGFGGVWDKDKASPPNPLGARARGQVGTDCLRQEASETGQTRSRPVEDENSCGCAVVLCPLLLSPLHLQHYPAEKTFLDQRLAGLVTLAYPLVR